MLYEMIRRFPMHNILEPISWLEGTWRTEEYGQGQYPTIKPFRYCDELQFTSIGQPMFNYEALSWQRSTKRPMHREVGFLKIIPETNKVALVASHNFGVSTIEEGIVENYEMKLQSTSISRMSEGTKEPAVTKIHREFRLVHNRLELTVYMATTTNPVMTEHLRARYIKLLSHQ